MNAILSFYYNYKLKLKMANGQGGVIPLVVYN
jgi:hypothetical protein